MITKIIVIAVMLIIIGALASSLVFLVSDKGKSKRTITALTWRISLSLLLFLFLLLAFKLHWITPHGVG
jgi:hypothetical protein